MGGRQGECLREREEGAGRPGGGACLEGMGEARGLGGGGRWGVVVAARWLGRPADRVTGRRRAPSTAVKTSRASVPQPIVGEEEGPPTGRKPPPHPHPADPRGRPLGRRAGAPALSPALTPLAVQRRRPACTTPARARQLRRPASRPRGCDWSGAPPGRSADPDWLGSERATPTRFEQGRGARELARDWLRLSERWAW